MSKSEENNRTWLDGLANVLGTVLFWSLVIGCCGEPDLIDATVAWVQRQP